MADVVEFAVMVRTLRDLFAFPMTSSVAGAFVAAFVDASIGQRRVVTKIIICDAPGPGVVELTLRIEQVNDATYRQIVEEERLRQDALRTHGEEKQQR